MTVALSVSVAVGIIIRVIRVEVYRITLFILSSAAGAQNSILRNSEIFP